MSGSGGQGTAASEARRFSKLGRIRFSKPMSQHDRLFYKDLPDAKDCLFPAINVSISLDEISEDLVSEEAGVGGKQNRGGFSVKSDAG